jgi:1-acyl-sn-glycerol-3-phosphate acyltransferase
VIANHPTLIDTTALLATVRHLCCVVPSGYYYNPALLPLLWCCGHLHARGRSIASGVGVLQLALQRLTAGHSLLIFPEGTRSPARSLGPFKRGAFEIAQQANVELVPVVLRVSRPVLNHSTPWYALPPQAVAYGIEVLPSFAVGYQSTKAASAHASKLFALALGISAQVEQQ